MISDEWISTEWMAAEINVSTKTLQRLRKDGVLLGGVHFYRTRSQTGPLFWNRDAVVQAIRRRSTCLES